MSTLERGVISPQADLGEDNLDLSLRPQNLSQFIGQQKLKTNLTVFLEAAKQRKEPLDHALFCAAPGLGKTTLAAIIAKEMGVNLRTTSGPILARVGDLAAILTSLSDGDVFFIDEIHRLNRAVEEALYPALEDFQVGHHRRTRSLGKNAETAAAEIHARRRHDARRTFDEPAARPVRNRFLSRIL